METLPPAQFCLPSYDPPNCHFLFEALSQLILKEGSALLLNYGSTVRGTNSV